MRKLLDSIKRRIIMKFAIPYEYRNDCKEYKRWNYNNPHVRTKNALEARVLRQAHILEKGMSLSKPREHFGVEKASELLILIDEYIALGYKIEDSFALINCIGVLDAYIKYHAVRGFKPEKVIVKFNEIKRYVPYGGRPYGIESFSTAQIKELAKGNFEQFFASRHSVRQFSDKRIDERDLEKAVALAMHAPSACNRQSCKVYFYMDNAINKELGKLIAGNTGFDDEVANYLVVTSDMSAFYDAFERNQVYVDGGIFAMALVEALHYYGIASCILQNGEFKYKNIRFKKICGNIPENEKIILFIAIGYYKDDVVTYATSHRKNLGDVLCVK